MSSMRGFAMTGCSFKQSSVQSSEKTGQFGALVMMEDSEENSHLDEGGKVIVAK